MDLARVVERIAAFLEGERVSFAVVGALGLHAYGVSRATLDLDLVTEARAQDAVVRFLESLGYETLHRSRGFSNHLHPDGEWGRIDLIYVDEGTATALFPACATRLEIAGRSLPVPKPEHLIAMKVQAIKNDPRRTLRDLADVQALLRLPSIDRSEVRSYFERAGLLDRYDELVRLL